MNATTCKGCNAEAQFIDDGRNNMVCSACGKLADPGDTLADEDMRACVREFLRDDDLADVPSRAQWLSLVHDVRRLQRDLTQTRIVLVACMMVIGFTYAWWVTP